MVSKLQRFEKGNFNEIQKYLLVSSKSDYDSGDLLLISGIALILFNDILTIMAAG